MKVSVLVFFIFTLICQSQARADAERPSFFPGFLGDPSLQLGLENVLEDGAPAGDITRAGWESPAFRDFFSEGLTVPGEKDPKKGWIHPGTARFYDFMEYLVFKKAGIQRASLALNCSEQIVTVPAGRQTLKMTRRDYAEEIFDQARIPREIFWLGAQESGFQDRAKSAVGAYGVWQFMAATGADYGVPGNKRADYVLATVAASKYLKKLYTQFGDWGLAMAAYNSGEGNVSKAANRIIVAAAKKGQSVSPTFWDIYGYLPSETRDYVPAILAWTRVALDPARFGFKPDGAACKQLRSR